MGFAVKHIELYLSRHMSPVCYERMYMQLLAHFESVIFAIYTTFFCDRIRGVRFFSRDFHNSFFSCGFDDFITIMCVRANKEKKTKK